MYILIIKVSGNTKNVIHATTQTKLIQVYNRLIKDYLTAEQYATINKTNPIYNVIDSMKLLPQNINIEIYKIQEKI